MRTTRLRHGIRHKALKNKIKEVLRAGRSTQQSLVSVVPVGLAFRERCKQNWYMIRFLVNDPFTVGFNFFEHPVYG